MGEDPVTADRPPRGWAFPSKGKHPQRREQKPPILSGGIAVAAKPRGIPRGASTRRTMKSWVPTACYELQGENLCTSTCLGVQSPAVTGGFGADSSDYFMHYNYKGIGEAALGTHKDKVNGDNQLFQACENNFC